MSYQINKVSGVPLYRQVKEYILHYIHSRGAESNMLPPEMEIGKRFGISRATVRTAIMELVQEGVVERIPGKGTFVKTRPNTLQFATWLNTETHTEPVISSAVSSFNKSRTDGYIELLGIPYLEIERRLMVMAAGGEAPDLSSLIYIWTPQLAYNGALEPLDSLYTGDLAAGLYPQALDTISYRGRYYGMNWGNAPAILYYRKDLLDGAGYGGDLKIRYYDELLDIFEMIHSSSKGTIMPFSIPILDDELFFLAALSNFLVSFGGGIFDENGEIILNAGENIAAFRWLKTFIKKGHVNVTNEYRKNRKLFAGGGLAFLMEGPWMRSMIPSLAGDEAVWEKKTGFRTLPMTPNGKSCSVLWNHTVSVFRQCKNKDLAKDFIRHLTLDPEIVRQYYLETGMLPARKSLAEHDPVYDDPFGRVLREQMKTAYPIRVMDPPSFLLSVTICAKAAREIILGDSDIPSTLNSHAGIIKAVQKSEQR